MAITLDGTTGITTPGLTNTGTETLVNLTTTGNTTLGDATTDTLTVGVTGIVKDASGNVGIGTATAGYGDLTVKRQATTGTNATFSLVSGTAGYGRLFFGNTQNAAGEYDGFVQYDQANRLMQFGTAQAERMRIDSSGNLLVGTTTVGGKLTVAGIGYFDQPSSGSVLYARSNSGGSGQGGQIAMTNTYASATTPNKYIRVDDAGNLGFINSGYTASIMYVTDAGAAYQGNNSSTWSTTSDIRIKTNVRDIGTALDKMLALHPCHFEYKNALGEIQTGFIAQEFETVLPGHVKEGPAPMQFEDLIEGDDKTIKTIDANLVPYLVKAIQEQQALIQSLTTRLTALETK
jgi:hypothetical protein